MLRLPRVERPCVVSATEPTQSPYLVDFDGGFDIRRVPTHPGRAAVDGDACERTLDENVDALRDYQRLLYADDRYSVLLIFQAMDAAGKDSTIRAVLSGVNPAGFQVSNFKRPSDEELDHDFLWRSARRLPERGRIGVFNRSYYEEVLVVRVHPRILHGQRIPGGAADEALWAQRFASIRSHEEHLARNGTVIRKFFLHVSKDEQRERFLDRIDKPHKNWKFSEDDLAERDHWERYMAAYQEALRETSRPWAPWYAIPADSKKFMRAAVAGILRDTFAALPLRYPELDDEVRERLPEIRRRLDADG